MIISKHLKESGEVDSNFANFKEGLKGAKDGALGSMAGKFDEAYSASQRNGTHTPGGWAAGKLSDRLNKAAKDVEDKGEKAFSDQENASDGFR